MQSKIGVVLFQLGGPDSREAIEPFLTNLFSDPDIIDFPLARLARPALARLIANRRAKHVWHHYEAIGGRSPILEYTQGQAQALEAELRRDLNARVAVAMRYWKPFTAEAVQEMKRFGAEQIVLLPLYPQYSSTTTGSSLREWKRLASTNGWRPQIHFVEQFHEDPAYLDAVVRGVNAEMARYKDPAQVDVVFSAHSVPVEVIEKGDPYQRQIERTMELVWERGGWPGRRHLCYQSKVGPSKWLRPMMREKLEELGRAGSRHVLMVPISFVSDHVETLFEINIEHREIAEKAGIGDFRMVPGLNSAPEFISALASLVRKATSTRS